MLEVRNQGYGIFFGQSSKGTCLESFPSSSSTHYTKNLCAKVHFINHTLQRVIYFESQEIGPLRNGVQRYIHYGHEGEGHYSQKLSW